MFDKNQYSCVTVIYARFERDSVGTDVLFKTSSSQRRH